MAKNSFEYRAIIRAVDKASTPMKKIQAAFSPLTGQFQTIGRAAKGVGMSVSKIFKPLSIIGIGGAAAMGAMVRKVADYGNAIADLSERTGFGTAALQEYSYVAKYSAMTNEEFAKSLETMNKNMGQMRAGSGPLVSGLEKISPVLLKQIQAAKSNEAAFELMIGAIQKVAEPARKAYLATTFFGKSGAKMVQVANKGADGIARLKKEARDFGMVMGQDAVGQSALFNDSIARLQSSIFGVSNAIISSLFPTVNKIMGKMTDWIVANRELISTKVTAFIQSAARAMQTMYNIGSSLLSMVGGLSGAFYIWGGVRILGVVKSLWTLSAAVSGLIPAFAMFFRVLKTQGILSAVKAVWSLNAAFAANPVGVVVMVIGGLIAVFSVLWNKCEWFRKLWIGLWDGIKWAFAGVFDWISSKIEWLWKYSPLRWIMKGIQKVVGWLGGGKKDHDSGLLDIRDNSPQMSRVNPNNFTNLSGGNRTAADINVKFDNLPRSAVVSTDTTGGPLVDLGVETGYAMPMGLR